MMTMVMTKREYERHKLGWIEQTRLEERQKVCDAVKKFERLHKEVDEEGNTDCPIMYNQIYRIASKREWLGTERQRQRAIKIRLKEIKLTNCYVCDFLAEWKEKNEKINS